MRTERIVNYGALWLFWIGCTIVSIAYGFWRDHTFSVTMSGPYWIAFTILAIQFLGVGQK
jgi:hypothetical protein